MRRARSIVAVILIVLGVLVLVYGGFSYTAETHDADLGIVQFQVKEKERVNLPVWAGVALIAVGAGGLLIDLWRR